MSRSPGKVHVWYMTEEERLAYIEKHPIKPYEEPTGTSFANIYDFKRTISKTKEERYTRKR